MGDILAVKGRYLIKYTLHFFVIKPLTYLSTLCMEMDLVHLFLSLQYSFET